MLTRGLLRVVLLFWLFATVGGCVSTSLAPVVEADFKPDDDEQKLWDRASDFDERVGEAEILFDDEAVDAYLDEIGRRLLAQFGAPDAKIEIHVYPDPLLNAFALPNGSIYLHSGFVARAENEAHLAAVLAHEISHYIRRHSLKEVRVAKNQHTAAIATSLIAALAGVAIFPGSFAYQLESVQTSGYARDLESEADRDAHDVLRRAGYDLNEAPKIFELMIEDAKDIDQPYYLGSHPKLSERLAESRRYLDEHVEIDSNEAARDSVEPSLAGSEPEPEPEAESARTMARYDDAIAPVLLKNAKLSFYRGLARKARANVARFIAARPDSVEGQMFLGLLNKSRTSQPGNRRAAADAYRAALRIEPDNAKAHRELGLMLRGTSLTTESQHALRRYLELEPEAPDRPVIEAFLADSNVGENDGADR